MRTEEKRVKKCEAKHKSKNETENQRTHHDMNSYHNQDVSS
jgi:hypothetical protein